MSRAQFVIQTDLDRRDLADRCLAAAAGTRVEFKLPRRSPEQNDLMWARLHDIAEQVEWYGQKLTAEDFKDMFTASLKRSRIVPNIDGDGFVQLGLRTSDMTKEEMSNLLDLMDAFAAERGVKFREIDQSDSSEMQDHHSRVEAPAASSSVPHSREGVAGVNPLDPGDLSEDWRAVYIQNLTGLRDKPASLLKRHSDAIQMFGGEPNESQLAWMRRVWKAQHGFLTGKIKVRDRDIEIERLRTIPLTEMAAA